MSAVVQALWSYPFKGLRGTEHSSITLEPGRGIPGDRAFAFLFHPTNQLPAHPTTHPWTPKMQLACQMRFPTLGALGWNFNETSQTVTVRAPGQPDLHTRVDEPEGRATLSRFMTAYLLKGTPGHDATLIGASDSSSRYPDRAPVHLSLLNATSAKDFARKNGTPIDLRRFRGNIIVDGLEAWTERRWEGRRFRLGAAVITVTQPIGRCANIEVDPDTGERNLPLVTELATHYGHKQFGMLAVVETGGTVKTGETLEPLS